MAPSQTLKWIEQGKDPSEQSVEIEGTEPYIVGGHTASGYWVNTNREDNNPWAVRSRRCRRGMPTEICDRSFGRR